MIVVNYNTLNEKRISKSMFFKNLSQYKEKNRERDKMKSCSLQKNGG